MNLVGAWVNLSRAYEIALLGGYSLQVIFDKEYKSGFDDYEKIKSFYSLAVFKKQGDLIVDIQKPEPANLKMLERMETLDDIHLRVEKAKAFNAPTEFSNSSCDALLDAATKRMNLSIGDRELIIKFASTIAQTEGAKKIEARHVAEGIHYRVYFADSVCNAEERNIQFGSGISIALTELDIADVNNAIEYLQSLL